MKALQGVDGHVEWVEAERPTCDAGQVRIRVAAAGLNRADLLQMKGLCIHCSEPQLKIRQRQVVLQWWSRSTTTQAHVRKLESIKQTLFLKKT